MQSLEDITKRIVEGYHPDAIILFGSSVGRSTLKENSDIDLLVIKDIPQRPLERRMDVERLLLDRTVPLDILVYTPEEVRKLYSMGSPFIEDIMEKGRILYMRKATKTWLKDAREEMESGSILLEHGKYRAACYHSQQCVEKGLKAIILEKGEKPERTHDIIELINKAVRLGQEAFFSMEDAVFLNSIYKGRYPAEEGLLPYGEPIKEDAERAVSVAKEFLGKAERILSGGA